MCEGDRESTDVEWFVKSDGYSRVIMDFLWGTHVGGEMGKGRINPGKTNTCTLRTCGHPMHNSANRDHDLTVLIVKRQTIILDPHKCLSAKAQGLF